MSLASMAAALSLAAVHLLAGRMRFLDVIPRSRWLSFASGISVAYVFLHLLPELGEAQEALAEWAESPLGFLDRHVYLLALVGLGVFYGLERLAKASRGEQRAEEGEDSTGNAVFWIHMASFAVYNALIGLLLAERERDTLGLVLFTIAIGLHFVVNDYGLRLDHKEPYQRVGRWILAAAILVGWGLALMAAVPEAVIAVPLAFIAGGVVLNVLKEELPEERQSRFSAFALGLVAYAALLLAM